MAGMRGFGFIVVSLTGCALDLGLPPENTAVCGNGEIETGEACDDGNAVSGDGCSDACQVEFPIAVQWSFATLAGVPQTCPAGSTVTLEMSNAERTPVVETFACVDNFQNVKREFLDWAVTFELEDATGAPLGEVTPPPVTTIGPREVSIPVITDGGFITVQWINKQNVLNLPSCSDYHATDVTGTLAQGTTSTPIDVPCTNPLVLGPFSSGSYTLDLAIGAFPIHAEVQVPAFSTVDSLGTLVLPVPQ